MYSSYLYPLTAYLCLRASAQCFFPNGSEDASGTQRRCNTGGGHSMCCLLDNVGAADADVCRGDGLCIPSDNTYLFRDTCTDRTWQDPACLGFCMTGEDDSGNKSESVWMPLTTCADGSLCCGLAGSSGKGRACCIKNGGLFLENGKIVSTKPASASATAQPTLVATSGGATPPSATPTSSSSSSSSSSNNTSAIVGGVVGGVAGLAILVLAFWFFAIRRQIRQRQQMPPNNYEPYQGRHGVSGDQKMWQEMAAPRRGNTFGAGELDTEPVRAPELDGAQAK